MMNVGLLCCGPLVDWLRFALPHPYRWACLVSAGCGALTIVLCAKIDLSAHTAQQNTVSGVPETLTRRPSMKGHFDLIDDAETMYMKQRRRRGFLVLVVLLVGVRALFRHLDATFPKYFIRRHGPLAPFGMVYSLEPLLIILLVPLVSSDSSGAASGRGCCGTLRRALRWIQKLPSLSAITLGCYIGTTAPFVLVLSDAEWASPLFVSIIALGETLWAPRFYTYTHEIAPQSEVGLYFSMAQVPLFLPKLIAGVMSGRLLADYCAAESDCAESARLWWWVGVSSLPFPFAIHWAVKRGLILEARAQAG